MARINGGVFLDGKKIDELLNPKDGSNIIGLAFKAIGHKGSRVSDYTAHVEVYAIYVDEKGTWRFKKNPYKPDLGRGIDADPNKPTDLNNFRFFHYKDMNIRHPEKYCFSFFFKERIQPILGSGTTIKNLFLQSAKIDLPTIKSFTLALQENKKIGVDDKSQIEIDGAPCPPFWKPEYIPREPIAFEKANFSKANLVLLEEWGQIGEKLKELFESNLCSA